MDNERDINIQTENAIIIFADEKYVSVQWGFELYKELLNCL
jgi:hypothetical protein